MTLKTFYHASASNDPTWVETRNLSEAYMWMDNSTFQNYINQLAERLYKEYDYLRDVIVELHDNCEFIKRVYPKSRNEQKTLNKIYE